MPGAQNMQLMNALRNNDREMSPLPTKDSLFHRHFHHFGQDYLNPVMSGQGLLSLCLKPGNRFCVTCGNYSFWRKEKSVCFSVVP